MKMQGTPAVALTCLILIFSGCKKNTTPNSDELDNSIYTSNCTINEIYWLADNQSVLMNDFCEGSVKKINSVTKSVQYFNLVGKGHLIQGLFYTAHIPQTAFYIALTTNGSGPYSMPLKLFSLDLVSGNSTLVRDSITQLVAWGGYTLGNKKLSIKSGNELLVIDLEQATTQVLPISESVQAFSPDDSRMLMYPSQQTPITTASVYDFNCQCLQPISLNGTGTALWRTQGIYAYNKNPSTLDFLNLQSGLISKSFADFVYGPWIANNSSLAAFFVKGPNYPSDSKGQLQSFDFITGQIKVITTTQYIVSGSFISGIYLAAVSPDQRKIAYALGGNLRILNL